VTRTLVHSHSPTILRRTSKSAVSFNDDADDDE
jgi:hypothetical protein